MTDMGLIALLKAAKEIAPELSEELISNTYKIEKEHQFDKDDQREISVKLIQKIIDDELNARGLGESK